MITIKIHAHLLFFCGFSRLTFFLLSACNLQKCEDASGIFSFFVLFFFFSTLTNDKSTLWQRFQLHKCSSVFFLFNDFASCVCNVSKFGPVGDRQQKHVVQSRKMD